VDPDPLAVAIDRRKRGESVTAIAKHLEIGRSTLYRALEPHLAEAPTTWGCRRERTGNTDHSNTSPYHNHTLGSVAVHGVRGAGCGSVVTLCVVLFRCGREGSWVTSIERTAYPFPQFKRLTSVRMLHVFLTSMAEEVGNAPAGQEKLINTLLANPVIFHNAVDITDIVHGLVAEGWTITAGQLAALPPYRARISRFGAYATDELTHQPDPFDPALLTA
jgi:hypothetical protein